METCTEDVNKIREEAEAKIFSLENKLSLVKLDNMNLRNDMKRLENDCGTLRSENITLKTNLKEVHNKSEKLQEKINAMTLEIEVMNFNDTQKGGSCDIGIQAEITDDGSDLASIIVDGFCEELSCIPRIISPLEDVLCENGRSRLWQTKTFHLELFNIYFQIFVNHMNPYNLRLMETVLHLMVISAVQTIKLLLKLEVLTI